MASESNRPSSQVVGSAEFGSRETRRTHSPEPAEPILLPAPQSILRQRGWKTQFAEYPQGLFAFFGGADFVADDAAHGRAADRAHRTAAGQNGATDSTGAGTDNRVLILRRHTGTPAQSE